MIDLLPFLDDERTEPPSERRLRESARKGSQPDAASVARPAAFVAAVFALQQLLPGAVARFHDWTCQAIAGASSGALPDLSPLAGVLGGLFAPVAAAAVAASLVTRAAVGSHLWASARLEPDTGRLLGSGTLRPLAPLNLLANAGWCLLKLAAFGAVAWWACPPLAAAVDPAASLKLVPRFLLWLGLAWLVLGALEFGAAAASFRASLWMTRREVEDERRSTEGDPRMAARKKQWAEQRLRGGGAERRPPAAPPPASRAAPAPEPVRARARAGPGA